MEPDPIIDPIIDPIDPRPFIVLFEGTKKERTIYKDQYTQVDKTYPKTFEEYAKKWKAPIRLADTEPAVDVGAVKAEGKTKAAIELNNTVDAAAAAVTPDTELAAIAESYFREDLFPKNPPSSRFSKQGDVITTESINMDKLPEWLGDRYDLWTNYKNTGKLDLTLVPPSIIENALVEGRNREREVVLREVEGDEFTPDEVRNTAAAMRVEGGAAVKKKLDD